MEQPQPEFTEAWLEPELSEGAQRVREKLTALMHPNNPRWIDNAEAVGEFADRIRARYGSALNGYELWHRLAGSGKSSAIEMPHYDFDGECSVEAFVDTLYDQNVAAGHIVPSSS